MPALLLCISIVLSCGRNILSKNISSEGFGTKRFFLLQSIIFFIGTIVFLIVGLIQSLTCSLLSIIYAIIYGVMLILAQWNITIALAKGKTGICSTLYSLGFVFPIIFSAIFYSEAINILDIIGIILVMFSIVLLGIKKSDDKESSKGYFVPLIIAMMCSGGLAIMQKVQSYSSVSNERIDFMLISFAIASFISLLAIVFGKGDYALPKTSKMLSCVGIGLAFACCNFLNTLLSALMVSSILFPVLNIGVIVLTALCGRIFFKEKLTKIDYVIFAIGLVAIILLTIN